MGSILGGPNYRARNTTRRSPLGPISMPTRPSLIRRLALLLLLVVPPRELTAQRESQLSTGRIVGRVIDAASGVGIADAGVQVVGTTLGVRSGVDGRFAIAGVPAGTVTLQVRWIGFATKQVTGLVLEGGKSLAQS